MENRPALLFLARPWPDQTLRPKLISRWRLSEGLLHLHVAQAFGGQPAQLPLPPGFFRIVRPRAVVDNCPAQLLVHPSGKVVAVIGQQTCRPFLDGRSRFTDRRVQRAQITPGPVVGRGGGEPRELNQRGRTPLLSDETVKLMGDALQLGAPPVLQVGLEVLLGPRTPVTGDEVPYPLEALPACSVAHVGGKCHLPVRCLHCTGRRVGDFLLRAQHLLGSTQLSEEDCVDGTACRPQGRQRLAVIAVDAVQGSAGVGAFTHEPCGQGHTVPELARRTQSISHGLVRPRVADDTAGVTLQCHGFPQPPDLMEYVGWQPLPVQLRGEALLATGKAHEFLINQTPQGRHPRRLDGMALVKARPPAPQHCGPLLDRRHGAAPAEEGGQHRLDLGLRDARLGSNAGCLGGRAHIQTGLRQGSDDFLVRVRTSLEIVQDRQPVAPEVGGCDGLQVLGEHSARQGRAGLRLLGEAGHEPLEPLDPVTGDELNKITTSKGVQQCQTSLLLPAAVQRVPATAETEHLQRTIPDAQESVAFLDQRPELLLLGGREDISRRSQPDRLKQRLEQRHQQRPEHYGVRTLNRSETGSLIGGQRQSMSRACTQQIRQVDRPRLHRQLRRQVPRTAPLLLLDPEGARAEDGLFLSEGRHLGSVRGMKPAAAADGCHRLGV